MARKRLEYSLMLALIFEWQISATSALAKILSHHSFTINCIDVWMLCHVPLISSLCPSWWSIAPALKALTAEIILWARRKRPGTQPLGTVSNDWLASFVISSPTQNESQAAWVQICNIPLSSLTKTQMIWTPKSIPKIKANYTTVV